MATALVARQPIFDRKLDVVAYELLFRSGALDRAEVIDDENATATVMLNSLTEIGIERLVGSRLACINVSRDFILGGYAALLPAPLFVMELLEDQLIDSDLVQRIQELTDKGYRFALDDFVYDATQEPLIELASYIKLDLMASGPEQFTKDVELLQGRGVQLLAEKLETHEDYRLALELGCDLFQGYFYCRPETIKRHRADAERTAVLRLLATLQDPEIELHQLDTAIAQDPRLSYRLLRYMNSAFLGLGQEVRSIRQAVALLGIENLKRWTTLSLFAMVDGKPAELTRTALTRARFCELTATQSGEVPASELFTVGLLSVIDALLDMPIDELLAGLPIASEIADAMIERTGPYGRPLQCVIALESGDGSRAEGLVARSTDLYSEALIWADDATEALTPLP